MGTENMMLLIATSSQNIMHAGDLSKDGALTDVFLDGMTPNMTI
jgi:hypothetical protein